MALGIALQHENQTLLNCEIHKSKFWSYERIRLIENAASKHSPLLSICSTSFSWILLQEKKLINKSINDPLTRAIERKLTHFSIRMRNIDETNSTTSVWRTEFIVIRVHICTSSRCCQWRQHASKTNFRLLLV